MTENINQSIKKPGIVIFVSILNFFSAAAWFFVATIFIMLVVFGNALGFYQSISNQIQEKLTAQNYSIGLNVIFSFFLGLGLFFALYHLILGIGLLKGKGAAWYVQIATAIIGLIMIPYGTIISIVILVFFFQSNVRSYFKV
jgi:hypothetical protein